MAFLIGYFEVKVRMKLVDLTMSLNNLTPVYPGDSPPEFRMISSLEKEGWNTHRICMSTHFGTHIDAPWHMLEDGKRLTDYSIEEFVGKGVMVDLRDRKKTDVNLDNISKKEILLLRTDHTQTIDSPDYFTSFPVISKKLAEQIVKMKFKIVGIDSFTMDADPFIIHKYFFKNNIICLENLVNLHFLSNKSFTLFVLPLKLDKMDGAPCRVVAQIE